MAKIFFSMAGEGRGHAARARTIIELLRAEHQITVFAPHSAYELLSESYANTDVRLLRIPGLVFHYHNERLSILRTLSGAAGYLRQLGSLTRRLVQEIEREKPDLVVTDFEPSLPRAARNAGVPIVSVDHQHFLVVSDLSCLPLDLRLKAEAMGWVVRGYCWGQVETVVSSFYFPPLKQKYCSSVVQTGVLLRSQIEITEPEQGRHLTVYLRRFAPPRLLESLSALKREVHIYGLGNKPSEGNLHFHPICEQGFLWDLATCDSLITNAGNQLVGEALFLGKPVLAVPEGGNFEQQINARFLRASKGGDWLEVSQIDDSAVQQFLRKSDHFRNCPDRFRMNGNRAALEAIHRHLPAASASQDRTIPAPNKRASA